MPDCLPHFILEEPCELRLSGPLPTPKEETEEETWGGKVRIRTKAGLSDSKLLGPRTFTTTLHCLPDPRMSLFKHTQDTLQGNV